MNLVTSDPAVQAAIISSVGSVLAAVIAAVLGIVLLSSLGLYIFISQPESDSGPAVPLNLFESELSARGEKKNNSEKNQIQQPEKLLFS